MGRYIFTQEEIEYVKQNYYTSTNKQLANALGFSEKLVMYIVHDLKLSKKRKINKHYFGNIDTALKAYLLGYIYADGWVVYNPNSNNYELGMELQIDDEYILAKINEELGAQNIIQHNKPRDIWANDVLRRKGWTSRLRVYSKDIVEDLMSHGVLPCKSSRDVLPNVDDEFFFDFLRGYIDGDGCFYTSKGYTYMHITCASKAVLELLQTKLRRFGIDTKIYTEREKKHRLACVNIHEMKKLVNKLYGEKDSFCLIRKKTIVEHYLGLAV